MSTPTAAKRHPYAVFYGDSILTGWRGTTAPRHRWPVLVCERLGWRESTLALDGMGYVRRRGPRDETGEPAPSDSDTTLLDAVVRLRPDVVVVCLGANDLAYVAAAADQIETSVRRDLARLRTELPEADVVVTTYFPALAPAVPVRHVEGLVLEVCGALGLGHLELYALAIAGDETLLCDDRVHPNDRGHRALADVMAPVLGRLRT